MSPRARLRWSVCLRAGSHQSVSAVDTRAGAEWMVWAAQLEFRSGPNTRARPSYACLPFSILFSFIFPFFFLIFESPFEFQICGEFALTLIIHLENTIVVFTYL